MAKIKPKLKKKSNNSQWEIVDLPKAQNGRITLNPADYQNIPSSSDSNIQTAQRTEANIRLQKQKEAEQIALQKQKLQKTLQDFQKANIQYPKELTTPVENKSSFYQDYTNTPVNEFFTPEFGYSKDPYNQAAAREITQMNAMDWAGNAIGVAPITKGLNYTMKAGNSFGERYLPNAYKINPWRFKPNPEAYYRGIGKIGYDEAIANNALMPKFKDKVFLTPDLKYAENFSRSSIPTKLVDDGTGLGFKTVVDVGNIPKGFNTQKYIAEVSKSTPGIEKYHAPFTSSEVFTSNNPITLNNVKFYKEDWLRGYKPVEVPKQGLTFGLNSNIPTQSNFGSIYTLNPLTLLGEKLPEQAYRKIGNSAGLQDIIESGVVRAKNQTGYGTPYFAPNTTWEGYNGVYAVGYQPNVSKGQYLQRASKTNPHRGVVPANERGVMSEIPFNEQTTLYRRLPFTSAYKTVPKEYLQNPNAHLLTNP